MIRVLAALIAMRVLLFALCSLNGSFDYGGDGPKWQEGDGYRYRVIENRWFDPHNRWDGNGYLTIAWTGYFRGKASNTAFFPGYSWIVKSVHSSVVKPILGNEVAARKEVWVHTAHLTSWLLFVAAACLFFVWARGVFGETAALRAVILIACYPVSLVFTAILSESTFFFAAILALMAAERRMWPIAGLAGALCATSRSVAGLIVIPLALMYLEQKEWKLRRVGLGWLSLLFVPFAVFCVLLVMAEDTGDLFAYVTQQRERFGHTSFPSFHGLKEIFYDSFRDEFNPDDPLRKWRNALQAGGVVFGLAGLALTWHRFAGKPYRVAYTAFVGVFLAVTALSGALLSMARYTVVLFPIFAALGASIERRRTFWIVVGLQAALLASFWIMWIHNWELVV